MATVDKKYLDLEGLKTYKNKVKELIDDKVAKETGTLRTYFDYFCIGVLGILLFVRISVALTPPKQ